MEEGPTRMMTERQYVSVFPFLAAWGAPLRAQFLEGMQLLQGEPVPEDTSSLVGVMVIDDDSAEAFYLPREIAVAKAREDAATPDALAQLNTNTRPGILHVLIVTDSMRLLLEVPVNLEPIPTGMEN